MNRSSMAKILDAANQRVQDIQQKHQHWILGRAPPVSFYVTDLGRAFRQAARLVRLEFSSRIRYCKSGRLIRLDSVGMFAY
jgi:hypothetical protein